MNMKLKGNGKGVGLLCVCVRERGREWGIITEAVCLVGNKGLAGGGYLLLSTHYGFDDEVLHLSHQHWHGDNADLCCISHHTHTHLHPPCVTVET